MRYALLSGGIVINTIEQDALPTIPGEWLACPGHVGPRFVFDGTNWIAPPELSSQPWEWFIDIGPFFDRFGDAKMAVLTSTDAGIKAIVTDCTVRKWIDLQRADVVTALAYIGSVVPAVDAALRAAILTTPVGDHENLALRKLYFGTWS